MCNLPNFFTSYIVEAGIRNYLNFYMIKEDIYETNYCSYLDVHTCNLNICRMRQNSI